MIKNHKIYHIHTILFVLLLGLFFVSAFSAYATEVDRNSFCDLEGIPGDVIDTQVTLTGTSQEERTGFWDIHYKEVEGDDSKMDITSWITIEPNDYVINKGEIKSFVIKAVIPENAGQGLWGAISTEAGMPGHSGERRTYIIFKDAVTGGNVYSGLLLPVAINVLPSPNPFAPVINFIKQNIMTVVLSIVIIVLLVVLLPRRKRQVAEVAEVVEVAKVVKRKSRKLPKRKLPKSAKDIEKD